MAAAPVDRQAGAMLFAVNYHYVRDSFSAPFPSIFGVTPDGLERELRLLAGVCRIVSGGQLLQWLDRGLQPPQVPSLIITFDDGLREQYDLALPILERLGLPALFFINTSPLTGTRVATVHKLHLLRAHISPQDLLELLRSQARKLQIRLPQLPGEQFFRGHYRYDSAEAAKTKFMLNFLLPLDQRRRLVGACFASVFPGREPDISRSLYMDWNQVEALACAGMMGSHSHEHLPLGRTPTTTIRCQIRASLNQLQRLTGHRPRSMSYPFGSREACSQRVAEIAAEEGVRCGFTMERAGNRDLQSPLLLGRFSNTDLPFDQGRAALSDFLAKAPAAVWGCTTRERR